jgi:hypothetical protein
VLRGAEEEDAEVEVFGAAGAVAGGEGGERRAAAEGGEEEEGGAGGLRVGAMGMWDAGRGKGERMGGSGAAGGSAGEDRVGITIVSGDEETPSARIDSRARKSSKMR